MRLVGPDVRSGWTCRQDSDSVRKALNTLPCRESPVIVHRDGLALSERHLS